ncbi:RluA family pseudouridine synthase [Leyella stercorea]|uniref:Pseudouridine synthase n=1 Tax=Leyella stercorea CAG:629 TaxID=1263103 RepID=R7GVK5_9BACT|nr:RluA family pseudouridine synthase [Leyella stercorea]CDE30738.1 pseudouridine synthase [Leyella stercorea CAG:629]
MLHALSTSLPSPRQFTYPFCYDVDPLAEAASEELQHYIATTGLMSAEKGCGKMFGVLVVEYKDEEGALQRGFLAAYSGLLGGRNDWPYFVPPVFDAQQPDGHFKRMEREISAINREISAIEHDPQYLQSVAQHEETMKRLQAEVEAFKVEVDAAKARRDARRKSGEPLNEEEQAEMVRESQFMKAELRRRRKAMEQAESAFHNPHATLLKSLQLQRKQMSDELQRWLFAAYRMLNAKGEERDLIDIFREYTHAMPPAGAGDCCAPKLLQYAYQHRLRPVCMAEFWWGESPASEIRHHLHYYPACRSKCLPILTHMLKGLDVAPNPLAQKRHTAEPRVLYADEYILVVDKPAGMLSVPGKAESVRSEFSDSANISVEEYFAQLTIGTVGVVGGAGIPARTTAPNYSDNNSQCRGQESPRLLQLPTNSQFTTNSKFLKAAHRLDMDTSGLLVLARTEQAYVELQRQFASRETVKRYEAVLSGVPKHIVGGYGIPAVAIANSCSHLYFYGQGLRQECRSLLRLEPFAIQFAKYSSGSISLPLIADINDRPRQRVDMEHGKPAYTLYDIKKVDKGRTLIHLYPKTGRTHQLRVHCAHPLGLACPILGDPLYGTERADRMYLHAAELTFRHPITGEPMHFLSPSGFLL